MRIEENYPSIITIMKEKEQKYNMPKKGACGCKRGIHRDNCSNCEGTGIMIDWNTFHNKLKRK